MTMAVGQSMAIKTYGGVAYSSKYGKVNVDFASEPEDGGVTLSIQNNRSREISSLRVSVVAMKGYSDRKVLCDDIVRVSLEPGEEVEKFFYFTGSIPEWATKLNVEVSQVKY
ncbi:MAG: hypothetical protein CSA97_02675 [Bacteroidetes bacterium]|nr:MAG: hypothetical protein CSA97_02675 [Bacteroidota bacterium]